MKLFDYFFCSAYKAYNTSGTETDINLRLSAISLITLFVEFNIISIITLISFIKEKFLLPTWSFLIIGVIIMFYYFKFFSKEKTQIIRTQYNTLTEREKNRNKRALLFYKVATSVVLLILMSYSVYLQNKRGYVFK